MPERTKWIDKKRHGSLPIYTKNIGQDDPYDDWPMHIYAGKVYRVIYHQIENPIPGVRAELLSFP